jgi:preprotein translocase subunit Sss1
MEAESALSWLLVAIVIVVVGYSGYAIYVFFR